MTRISSHYESMQYSSKSSTLGVCHIELVLYDMSLDHYGLYSVKGVAVRGNPTAT